MSIERIVREEIESEIGELSKMELGTEEYARTVKGVNDFIDRLNESKKIELEAKKLEIEEDKNDIELQRVENDKKLRKIGYGVTIGTFIGAAAIQIWANIDSKHFEIGNTHTTEAGRSSTRKLLSWLDKVKI